MKKIFMFLFLMMSFAFYAEETVDVSKDDYFKSFKVPENVTFQNIKSTNNFFELEIFKETTNDFLRKEVYAVDSELFPTRESKTLENIKLQLSKKNQIYGYSYSSVVIYDWIEFDKAQVSIQYSQERRKAYGCGVYVIRVFVDDIVYTIRITDLMNKNLRNDYFDTLTDFMEFKVVDNVEEGPSGYFFYNEQCVYNYYEYLNNDKNPESYGYKFVNVKDQILDSLEEIFSTSK